MDKFLNNLYFFFFSLFQMQEFSIFYTLAAKRRNTGRAFRPPRTFLCFAQLPAKAGENRTEKTGAAASTKMQRKRLAAVISSFFAFGS